MARKKWWILGGLGTATALAALVAAGAADMARVSPARSIHQAQALAATQGEEGAGADAIAFAHGDMGALDLDTLETTAMPWRLVLASLALREAGGDPAKATVDLAYEALRRAGFLFPKLIANAPDLPPTPEPLGMTFGMVERSLPPLRVMAANLGCASCHAGVTYDQTGRPLRQVAWLGMPNTSLDLQAYTTMAYEAMRDAFKDEGKLKEALGRLFPDMGWREWATLRLVILPKAGARIRGIEAGGGRPLPFPNGAPGLTNGVGSLKSRLGLAPDTPSADGPGFVSIPDLGSRLYKSSFLADGAYAPKGAERFSAMGEEDAKARDAALVARLTSFFTVPSMGLTPDRANGASAQVEEAVRFIAGYRPQSYPARLDTSLLPLGRATYAKACAYCHGTYDESLERPRLLSFPNWHGPVGTDPARAKAFTPALAQAVAGTSYAAQIDAAPTGWYLAPPLTGIWASAPYLANGSVPTLRALLEPMSRPVRFPVGGHALDLKAVGIALVAKRPGETAYPEGYKPFSTPSIVDTTLPGFSNRGHEGEVAGLTAEERDALLEYLKLL